VGGDNAYTKDAVVMVAYGCHIYSLKIVISLVKQFSCVLRFSHLCVISQIVMSTVYTYVERSL
jgi:hypothetical protein